MTIDITIDELRKLIGTELERLLKTNAISNSINETPQQLLSPALKAVGL